MFTPRSIPDRLASMSRPPCENCGCTMIVLLSKDTQYSCPDCLSKLPIHDGIELMLYLNATPAYQDSLQIDPLVAEAYLTPEPPLSSNRNHDSGCPLCGAPMIERSGKHGPFFGCRRYPDCKGTRKGAPR